MELAGLSEAAQGPDLGSHAYMRNTVQRWEEGLRQCAYRRGTRTYSLAGPPLEELYRDIGHLAPDELWSCLRVASAKHESLRRQTPPTGIADDCRRFLARLMGQGTTTRQQQLDILSCIIENLDAKIREFRGHHRSATPTQSSPEALR